jgi:hypothetical protein
MKHLIIALLFLTGCSHTSQEWTMTTSTMGVQTTDERKISKTSVLYWSKYSADSDIGGMKLKATNVESGVDSEAIQSLTELAQAVNPKFMGI